MFLWAMMIFSVDLYKIYLTSKLLSIVYIRSFKTVLSMEWTDYRNRYREGGKTAKN